MKTELYEYVATEWGTCKLNPRPHRFGFDNHDEPTTGCTEWRALYRPAHVCTEWREEYVSAQAWIMGEAVYFRRSLCVECGKEKP